MMTRALLCLVLAAAVAACSRDEPELTTPQAGPDATAAVDKEAGQVGTDPNEPGAVGPPIDLDLSLPEERVEVDHSLFETTPDPQLPDLFEASERERRTRFSGELIMGDGEDGDSQLDRIQGGSVEVEVSID
ncbi:MAG: hypothetical protein ACPG1A_12935 [Halioglobus sp.]